MDLWIRSQNKELLIPNPKLSLEDIKNEYWIIDIFDDTVLGTNILEMLFYQNFLTKLFMKCRRKNEK